MDEQLNILIQSYSNSPIWKYQMQDYDVRHEEGNAFCWDGLEMYVKFDEDKIKEISWRGDLKIITSVASSLIVENLTGEKIENILKLKKDYLEDLGFIVSERRQRSAILPLLALKNSIHIYKNDQIREEWEEFLED